MKLKGAAKEESRDPNPEAATIALRRAEFASRMSPAIVVELNVGAKCSQCGARYSSPLFVSISEGYELRGGHLKGAELASQFCPKCARAMGARP